MDWFGILIRTKYMGSSSCSTYDMSLFIGDV